PRPLVEWLGIGVAALFFVEFGQIVQCQRDRGVIGPERFLIDRQQPLVERLGIGVATLFFVEFGQIVQRRRKDDIGQSHERWTPDARWSLAEKRTPDSSILGIWSTELEVGSGSEAYVQPCLRDVRFTP